MQFKYYNNIVPESFPALLDNWSFKQSSLSLQHSILVSTVNNIKRIFFLLSINKNILSTFMILSQSAILSRFTSSAIIY